MKTFQKKFNCVGDYRGKGLFYAIEFIKDKKGKRLINWTYNNYFKEVPEMKMLLNYLWKKKLFCYGRYNMLYICPPLVISKKNLIKGLNLIENGILENIEKKFF